MADTTLNPEDLLKLDSVQEGFNAKCNSEKKLICVLKNVNLSKIRYAFTALFP